MRNPIQGPLHDVKVLDFSTLLPGPMATLFLAEAGADVIKIERPDHGDDIRRYPPYLGNDSVTFSVLNRGKKSIAIDLKSVADRDRLTPLLRKADVVVEQFRPGVMERLGLGYNALKAINSSVIYCSITGYGQTGPKSAVAGHDLNYIGDSGLLALSHGPSDRPTIPPALVADIAGGSYPAIINILLALRVRDQTGQGSHLDISMTDGIFPFLHWAMGAGLVADQWPGNGDALLTGGSPRYHIYPAQDQLLVAAAPIEQKFWEAFCEAIVLPVHLRDDQKDPAATLAAAADCIASKPASHWHEVFRKADCCCSIVQTIEQALKDPHFHARGLFDGQVSASSGQSITAVPVPIVDQFRPNAKSAVQAPALGAANDDAWG